MSEIHFRIAAKTDVGLERNNNEDNFQVAANLDESPMKWVNNQEYSLGNKGALLVVADGMGGMNAGEVASEIAIETVCEMFAPEKITDEVVNTRYTIEKFMKGVIVEADKRIKAHAKDHPESQGMGTTIVIAWLFDGQLYASWCGDSRAYIYNQNTGLFQISKDHSYVQQLVDAGKISKKDAFDFPDSNIITRSLSDASPKASPDSLLMPQPLCNGDVILLCSDGLNGMIHDEEIEAIIAQNCDNMTNCVDSLIHAALEAAGADNCTVAVCQILSGGGESKPNRIPKYSIGQTANEATSSEKTNPLKKKGLWITLAVLLCAIVCGLILYLTRTFPFNQLEQDKKVVTDTIKQDKPKDENIETQEAEDVEAMNDESQDADAPSDADEKTAGSQTLTKKLGQHNNDKKIRKGSDDNSNTKDVNENKQTEQENVPPVEDMTEITGGEEQQSKKNIQLTPIEEIPNPVSKSKNKKE